MSYPRVSPLGGSPSQVARTLNTLLAAANKSSKQVATPLDFGAVGSGLVDDAAAFKAALESGEPIDGLGLTYAFSDEVMPASLVSVRNANLKWISTSAMTAQKSLLHLQGLGNWTVDNLDFDMGTVENTGSENDSGRRGLLVDTAGGTGFCDRVKVLNCTGHGKGNGTVFDIRNVKTGKITGNLVHDRSMIMGDPGTADNDAMDGLLFSFCDDCIITDNHVYDQTTSADGGTTYTNQYNRGVAISGVQNSIIANNHMRNVDQGFDFSGDLSVNDGNRALTIVGNTGTYCFSWAFKFVHGIRDSAVVGCIARYTGTCGFVFNNDIGVSGALATQRLYLSNCHGIHGWAGGAAQSSVGAWRGFRIMASDSTNGPANLRFDLCSAFDDQGYMDYGFHSENTVDTTSNIFRNCEVNGASIGQYGGGIDATAWRTL